MLALLPVGVANAQAPENLVTCQATAVTPLIRAEGIAELVGDITLICESSQEGEADTDFEVNVDLFTSAFVTNNRSFAGVGADITDAVLVINENNGTTPVDTGGVTVCAGQTNSNGGGNQCPQFGLLAANNNLRWNGVVFPIPDGNDSGNALQTILRITSVRVNASMLGVPDENSPSFTQVQADLVITGESAISVNQNVFNIGLPLRGLIVEAGDVASGLQCDETEVHGSFTINEGFPTAFKTLGEATFTIGSNIQNEAGYYGSDTGGATQATRFLATFFNIPEGVRIAVEEDPDCTEGGLDSDHLALTTMDCDVNGDVCSPAIPIAAELGECFFGDPAVEVDIDGGSGWIGFEVTDDWTIASEDCEVAVWVCWTPDTENDLPAPGTGQMSVSFAPLSTVGTSTEDVEPRPRFLDGTGSDPENIVNVVKCTSTILFPFVSNQNSFDTGLVVSNTSEDWLGTDPQDGACEIHYHGSTTGGGAAPPTDPTSVINAGEQLIWLLSSGNPAQDVDPATEFQGYVIVVCDFQYGHGYAFISDGFGSVPTLAQGYLGLILELDESGVRAPLPEALNQ